MAAFKCRLLANASTKTSAFWNSIEDIQFVELDGYKSTYLLLHHLRSEYDCWRQHRVFGKQNCQLLIKTVWPDDRNDNYSRDEEERQTKLPDNQLEQKRFEEAFNFLYEVRYQAVAPLPFLQALLVRYVQRWAVSFDVVGDELNTFWGQPS